jgi:hypothetical protein
MFQQRPGLWCTGTATVAVLVFLWLFGSHGTWRRAGPRTFDDVIAIAEPFGLYYASDDIGGIPKGRLVLSRLPLTCDRAARVRINVPQHPCWIGTVAVYTTAAQMAPNYDPTCSVFWGEMFVYGDPALVELLTGIRPLALASQ